MRVSRADLLELWPAEELVVQPGGRLDSLGIPRDAARILTEVGLPRAAEPFFFADDLVSQSTAADGGRLWNFGGDGGVSLAIDAASGHVLAGADAADMLTRFVNTSLDQFAASLCTVVAGYRRFPGLPDPQIDEQVALLEQGVRAVDPSALDGPDHWWMVLIEQMRDGLL